MERRKKNIEAYRKASGPIPAEPAADEKMPAEPSPPRPAASKFAKPQSPAAAAGSGVGNPAGPSPAFRKPPAKNPEGLLKITGRDTSVRKAAKFLMLIGREEAGKVLRHFTDAEIEAITREIAGIKRIEGAEAEKLLAEFGFLKEAGRYPAGGVETARRILVGAFGEEKGREILQRSVPAESEKFFGFLEDFEPNQIHHLLRSETPAVLAVILPYLSPGKASAVLPLFDPDFRRSLVPRMARKERIHRDVLLRMDEALREKARGQAVPADLLEVDGKGVLAEILKYVDLSKEEEILRRLEDESPVVAEEIKARLFTIDILDYMDETDLQKLLQGMADKDIALLLKGKSDAVRAKILSNLSERRRTFVADEYRILGPVPKREADEATKEFLAVLKRLEAEGTIVFRRASDRWVE